MPFEGNPLESATSIEESTIATALEVVLEAVSKSEALVTVNEVTEAFIPPLSLRVVCVYD